MFNSKIQYACFAVLFLANSVIGDLYRFSIQEVDIGITRDLMEDDLFLSIASIAGSSKNSTTWGIGSFNKNESISWGNLTQDVDISSANTNLSITFGLLNIEDADKANDIAIATSKYSTANLNLCGADSKLPEFTQAMFGVAAAIPGPQAPAATVLGMLVGYVPDFLNCTGPVAVGNVVYDANVLKNLTRGGEATCDTQHFLYKVPINCGFQKSNYTVNYCLARLNVQSTSATSAALTQPRGLPLVLATFGMVLLWTLW